jgi:hypothetical protein
MMWMPSRRQEWPERAEAVKVAQMGETRRVGSPGQMCSVPTRGWTVCVGERVRSVWKHAMRSCAARPVADRRPAAMRDVDMRAASAEPDVGPAADASGAADMPAHAMTANVRREMWPAAANVTR